MVSIADLNGDGRDDLLMQKNDGTFVDWLGLANGNFVDNSVNFTIDPGSGWHIQTRSFTTPSYNPNGNRPLPPPFEVAWRMCTRSSASRR